MITQFKGQYEFLDPAYYCLAEYDGVIYNSAEAAFLASQSDDPYFRSMSRNPSFPIWRARELCERLQKPRDWTLELSLDSKKIKPLATRMGGRDSTIYPGLRRAAAPSDGI